jgi:outer membrane protein OmpA-like peptidoglycan-associated protein
MNLQIHFFCWLLALMVQTGAMAQTEPPSTESIIEQLTPKATAGHYQRKMRNLIIESHKANAAPSAAPSISLHILFDFNSDRITSESHIVLERLVSALQSPALQGFRFSVEGHTDAKGSAEVNQRLSQRRAEAVCDFLRARGVAHDRLLASGKGASQLANPSAPYSAENRRVKIINIL